MEWISAFYGVSWIAARACTAEVGEIGRTFIASYGESCKKKMNMEKLEIKCFISPLPFIWHCLRSLVSESL